ncbi:hypothetical protein [uncultured Rhodospira sp.]|uniref:hypothetical protein n=1 Tax=uncultured Rhodospira sp. TaxID=1936189 RepID=UPI00261EC6B0|nr:hypothetical protein [uncultured Rhodospira sp.]
MATSEVEICNSAFVKIGEDTIVSMDEDRKQARFAKRQYPIKRRQLLRSYRWNFAIRRTSLAPEASAPSFGFNHKFLLPYNAIKVIGLYDENEPQNNYTSTRTPFKVEGRYILADEDTLRIFYLEDVIDPNQFDPMFTESLSWFLAWELGYALSGGPQIAEQARQSFYQSIREARFADAIEGQPEIIQSSEWLDSRRTQNGPGLGPVLGA